MMSRQTFYLSTDVTRELKRLAYDNKTRLSHLVNAALRRYLRFIKQKPSKTHSLTKYANKIHSFKKINPIEFQRQERQQWKF